MSLLHPDDFILSLKDKDFKLFDNSFDDYFDYAFGMNQCVFDSSTSSNESNCYDDLELLVSSSTEPISVSSSTIFTPLQSTYRPISAWPQQSTEPIVPKSQKLAHSLRPDGAVISRSQLLSIEGKITTPQPSRLTTPPSTPSRRLRQFSPPQKPRRSNKVGKTPARIDTPRPKMMQASNYYVKPESPLSAGWTERFNRSNLSSSTSNNTLPLSPASSVRITQTSYFPDYSLLGQAHSQTQHTSTFGAPLVSSATNHGLANPNMPTTDPSNMLFQPIRHDSFTTAIWDPLSPSAVTTHFTSPWAATKSSTPIPYNPEFGMPTPAQSTTPSFVDPFTTAGLMIDCGPFDPSPNPHPLYPHPLSAADIPHPHIQTRAASPALPLSPSPSPSPLPRTRRPHSRKTSAVRTPKTPRGSHRRSGSSSASDPFVNFTPSDSRKILTGVAPSGSSKTKARREREASERRRKLSEKAEQAVRDAGGDWEGVRGLLVEV